MAGWDVPVSSSRGSSSRDVRSWRKSSHSSDGACVEVAAVPGQIMVRDSKDSDGAFLTFTANEWSAFIAGVKDGEFDLT